MFSPRLILQIEVIILLYYISFTFNQEKKLDAPSSYENNKNVVIGDQTHMQNTLLLGK